MSAASLATRPGPSGFRHAPRPILAPLVTGRGVPAALVAVALASAFLALTAQVAIDLRVGPVPISGQTFGVLLVGATLGARLGALSVVLYLVEGLAGLPVFAGGGAGWVVLSGPTGGYLAGFVAGAAIVGFLAQHGWDRRPLTMALAMTLGTAAIILCGVVRLSAFVGWEHVWAAGVQPFLAGDALKVALASGLLPGAWWLRERLGALLGGPR